MRHSPEVLREFYLIAINRNNISDGPGDTDRRGIVASDAVPLSRDCLPIPTLRWRYPRCELAEPTKEAEAALGTRTNIDGLGQTETGASQHKEFLKDPLVSRKNSACQQCRLYRFQCDLQRPSCWKCERYFLPCYYEDEETKDYRRIEELVDPEAEITPRQDSVRVNPYQNIEGKGKLHRSVSRRLGKRSGRLSKPMPPKRRGQLYIEDSMKEDEETLLGAFSHTTPEFDTISRTSSPTTSEPDIGSRATSLTTSGVSPPSRTDSQTVWAGSGLLRTLSRPGSSCNPSSTILTTPTTSGASTSWLPEIIETSWDDTPKAFQCTFCLKQCKGQNEWEGHELFQHIRKKIWICMPLGPVDKSDHGDVCAFCGVADPDSDHRSEHNALQCHDGKKDRTFISKEALQRHLSTVHNQTEMTPKMHDWSRYPNDGDWYWKCGFCDTLLPNWTDRVEHIGVHFNKGMVMSSWDPLTPPYPLDKITLNCATWIPPLDWDARTLWDLERNRKRSGWSWTQALEEQWFCRTATLMFASEARLMSNVMTSILAPYFFPIDRHVKSFFDDTCPFCNERFVKIAELYPEIDDIWDVRVLHLERGHNFEGCETACKSTCAGDVLLHLANIHNVSFSETTFEVLESCRKDERPLAKKMNMSAIKCNGQTEGHC
ncbi:uncharacterized protein PAC_08139 [Phialocephala subalpina]|uniref:Zn(2)-C6 fungal-type domain-containing protein n=1 Tax=Phialocephala subalpina TaxID=576137 RepID=A0A1L7WZR2_9HELO|nr:uncharacterized protein PAC_08139 [Phialocephala subalpina]